MIPTRDSNHAPSAIRADVLSQLDQKGHSVLGSFQILTLRHFYLPDMIVRLDFFDYYQRILTSLLFISKVSD